MEFWRGSRFDAHIEGTVLDNAPIWRDDLGFNCWRDLWGLERKNETSGIDYADPHLLYYFLNYLEYLKLKQDKTKNLLSDLFKQFPTFIKENKPTNKIISQIHSAINKILDEQENSEILEQKFLRYVMVRLIRPFYKRLKNIPESGKLNMFRTAKKILIKD